MTEELPVLLLGYLRKNSLLITIRNLISFDVKSIYISFDGARNSHDLQRQKDIIKCILDISQESDINLKINHGSRNLGVKNGVISGLNWFFSEVKAGIVIEDDLEISESFIQFCNFFVPKIQRYPEIWMVSGSQVLDDFAQDFAPILSRYPMIWGWATSAEKWKQMSKEIESGAPLNPFQFGFRRSYFWNRGQERVKNGILDTWDLPLAKAFLLRNKYCLISPYNLVRNIGFDEFSAHTHEIKFPLCHPIEFNYKPTFVNLDQVQYSPKYDCTLEDRVFRFRFIHSILGLMHYLLRKFLRS